MYLNDNQSFAGLKGVYKFTDIYQGKIGLSIYLKTNLFKM